MRSGSPIAEKTRKKGKKKDKLGGDSSYQVHGPATDMGFQQQNVVQNVDTFKNFLL